MVHTIEKLCKQTFRVDPLVAWNHMPDRYGPYRDPDFRDAMFRYRYRGIQCAKEALMPCRDVEVLCITRSQTLQLLETAYKFLIEGGSSISNGAGSVDQIDKTPPRRAVPSRPNPRLSVTRLSRSDKKARRQDCNCRTQTICSPLYCNTGCVVKTQGTKYFSEPLSSRCAKPYLRGCTNVSNRSKMTKSVSKKRRMSLFLCSQFGSLGLTATGHLQT